MRRKLSQLRAISYAYTKRNYEKAELQIQKLGLWGDYLKSKYKLPTTYVSYSKNYKNALLKK